MTSEPNEPLSAIELRLRLAGVADEIDTALPVAVATPVGPAGIGAVTVANRQLWIELVFDLDGEVAIVTNLGAGAGES